MAKSYSQPDPVFFTFFGKTVNLGDPMTRGILILGLVVGVALYFLIRRK